MKEFLFVGLGGAVGAMLRYGMHKTGMGITYILSSVLLCLLGVLLGKAMLHPL